MDLPQPYLSRYNKRMKNIEWTHKIQKQFRLENYLRKLLADRIKLARPTWKECLRDCRQRIRGVIGQLRELKKQ